MTDSESNIIRVPLTRGLSATIDASDEDLVCPHRWVARPQGLSKKIYAYSRRAGLMSRLLLGLTERGMYVDHIDGNPLNNRRCNLRPATPRQNAANRRTKRGKHLPGTRPHGNKWTSCMRIGSEGHFLGSFYTEWEAHLAYVEAIKVWRGEFFPNQFFEQIAAEYHARSGKNDV